MMFSKAGARRGCNCRLGPQIGGGKTAKGRLGKRRWPGWLRNLVTVKRLRSNLTPASAIHVQGRYGRQPLLMNDIHGETLGPLLCMARQSDLDVPVAVARRVLCDVLHDLHAAHTTSTERTPLCVLQHDVSTQGIMVGSDGIARMLGSELAPPGSDAGQATPRTIPSKRGYIAPEQVRREALDCRASVFAAGAVLWEMLCGKRLFVGETAEQVVAELLAGYVPLVSLRRADVERSLDDVVQQALSRDPAKRFASAQQFAEALEATGRLASHSDVAAWVRSLAWRTHPHRAQLPAELEARITRARPLRSSAQPWLPALGSNVALVTKPAVVLALGTMLILVVGCLSQFGLDAWRPGHFSADFPQPPIERPCVAATTGTTASPSNPEPASDPPTPIRPESLHLERRAGRPRTRAYAQDVTAGLDRALTRVRQQR